MESRDVVDDVNALLKMGVGDAYRLEHIKQSYIENSKIWLSDERYLEQLREKYLVKHNSATLIPSEDEDEPDGETIHCWKCGKKTPLKANFCMVCGASLFDVGSENKNVTKPEAEPKPEPKKQPMNFNIKYPIIIGIPIIVLIVLGAAYSQGAFEGTAEKSKTPSIPEPAAQTPQVVDPNDPNSKCGPGTIYDAESNSCVLENSKCGPGTIYDAETNSCILA